MAQQTKMKEVAKTKASEPRTSIDGSANNDNSAPTTKAQVVRWPPIRSFRKNSLATTSKNNVVVDGKMGVGALFVNVSMDGKCGSHGMLVREMLNETKLKDLLHGSEYVLTYEDKDGDWMLVGDVPSE